MNKGTINQLFQSPATYRIPKLVTLLTASCVLMAMVSLDASASTSGGASTTGPVLVSATATPPVASATPVYDHLGAHESTHTGATTFVAARPASKKVKKPSVGSILNPFTRTSTGHRKGTTHGSAPTTTTLTFSATTTLPPVKKTTGSAPVTAPPSTTTTSSPTTTTTAAPAQTPNGAYPVGISEASEPSGMAPPSANALAGYSQSYVTDFTGSSLPSQWDVFSGTPSPTGFAMRNYPG